VCSWVVDLKLFGELPGLNPRSKVNEVDESLHVVNMPAEKTKGANDGSSHFAGVGTHLTNKHLVSSPSIQVMVVDKQLVGARFSASGQSLSRKKRRALLRARPVVLLKSPAYVSRCLDCLSFS